MKVKTLIEELKKQDQNAEVYIYDQATMAPLYVPEYNPSISVSVDDDYAEEYEIPKGTVFITGK